MFILEGGMNLFLKIKLLGQFLITFDTHDNTTTHYKATVLANLYSHCDVLYINLGRDLL